MNITHHRSLIAYHRNAFVLKRIHEEVKSVDAENRRAQWIVHLLLFNANALRVARFTLLNDLGFCDDHALRLVHTTGGHQKN